MSKKGAGRPSIKPKRVTVTLSVLTGEKLQTLADESEVKLATFCAHILERYAMQGSNELMSNDVLIKRMDKTLNEHNTRFAKRFGDVLLRIAHEITAERRYTLIEGLSKYGEKENDIMRERSWELAVESLSGHVKRVEGEDQTNEEESKSGGERQG